jgi:site-specific DNA recombinase
VLSGAPFGYRYVRKSEHAGAAYEILEHEAVPVAELFRRYADGVSIAELTRWLTEQGVPTRTGKHRWDRSVLWGMLRGRRLCRPRGVRQDHGRARVPRPQPRGPAATPVHTTRVQDRRPPPRRLDRDRRARDRQRGHLHPGRPTPGRQQAVHHPQLHVPSLLQGIAACAGCGYGYYRTSTRTTNKKIYYYRCLGSDDYRYEGGRVCGNKPVRADYLDTVVWNHITALLATRS